MDSQEIVQAIEQVQHPEIKNTLVELGMVQDIQVDGEQVTLRLVLPFMGIPASVRDYMVEALQQVAASKGANLDVSLDEMTPAERERFFHLEQQNWIS